MWPLQIFGTAQPLHASLQMKKLLQSQLEARLLDQGTLELAQGAHQLAHGLQLRSWLLLGTKSQKFC